MFIYVKTGSSSQTCTKWIFFSSPRYLPQAYIYFYWTAIFFSFKYFIKSPKTRRLCVSNTAKGALAPSITPMQENPAGAAGNLRCWWSLPQAPGICGIACSHCASAEACIYVTITKLTDHRGQKTGVQQWGFLANFLARCQGLMRCHARWNPCPFGKNCRR